MNAETIIDAIEAGHWDIDIDRTSLHHPTLPGFDVCQTQLLRHSASERILKEILNRAIDDPRYFRLYRHLVASQDAPEVRSAVECYQSSLLMPDWLIHDAVSQINVTSWPALYDLAQAAQVNISNLIVRLHRLDIVFIPNDTRELYPGIDAWTGQRHLFAK